MFIDIGINFNECLDDSHVSTNGQCGTGNGRCPSGKCCYGWCGTGDNYCSISSGCQTEFGDCTDKIPYPSNIKCGKKDGKCPSDLCCNKDGYCGNDDDFCSISK